MAKLYSKYPSDVDVIAVYAESLMVLKPWALWVKDELTGEVLPVDDNTTTAHEVLTKVRAAQLSFDDARTPQYGYR